MPEDNKKDFLEFPLEEVSVPQSIALSMLAATKTVGITKAMQGDDCFDAHLETDNDRLQLLCEKLEARVEDELEKVKTPEAVPTEEDATDEATFTNLDGHQVSLEHEFVEVANEELITKVIVDNLVFVLACNERVFTDPDLGTTTTCIKRFNHYSPEHEDMEGNVR